MTTQTIMKSDEVEVRELIERWAKAVRAKDYGGILADHADEILMFDVPPPFESRGIEAYRKTWDLFFSMQPEPIAFDIQRMEVVTGTEVAFAMAWMRCEEVAKNGERVPLDFRLTVGLRKVEGKWVIVHEHHSVPVS